jgi:beta-lactamase superfamily II metal-dependent hydrolase
MFSLEMLPAGHGDALWIEYGDRDQPHRILIDGGTGPTYDVLRARVEALPPEDRTFELMVVSHIDGDHIEGMIRLLQDERLAMQIADLWFNGWKHLPMDVFAPAQGEILSALLMELEIPWNKAFDEGPACIPDEGPLPKIELEGGLRLTVLGPTSAELASLQTVWEREIRDAGLTPGAARTGLDLLFKSRRLQIPGVEYALPAPSLDVEALAAVEDEPDGSEANASSIILLAEFDGRSVLLAADGVPFPLEVGLTRLLSEIEEDALAVDAMKLQHHGSRRNVMGNSLQLVRSAQFLFSSNGAYYNHPDPEAVARVLVQEGEDRVLLFNYRTEENEVWDEPELKERWRYRTTYPEAGSFGMRLEL